MYLNLTGYRGSQTADVKDDRYNSEVDVLTPINVDV